VNGDLRVVKYVLIGRRGKLDLVVDVFNVLNVLAGDPHLGFGVWAMRYSSRSESVTPRCDGGRATVQATSSRCSLRKQTSGASW